MAKRRRSFSSAPAQRSRRCSRRFRCCRRCASSWSRCRAGSCSTTSPPTTRSPSSPSRRPCWPWRPSPPRDGASTLTPSSGCDPSEHRARPRTCRSALVSPPRTSLRRRKSCSTTSRTAPYRASSIGQTNGARTYTRTHAHARARARTPHSHKITHSQTQAHPSHTHQHASAHPLNYLLTDPSPHCYFPPSLLSLWWTGVASAAPTGETAPTRYSMLLCLCMLRGPMRCFEPQLRYLRSH
mmetsp:Transcript_34453/g.72547  ORF Transcript_34453/g.72547 Transcript_34453/m.72547 type:complete len:240 (-) Transcript_34453:545-1264(-)